MCRFIIVQCIAVIMIYCFQIYAKERYENPKLKREDDYVIEWHDKNLEKAIREQTRIETGNIKLSDLWKYKKLDFYNKGIKSIEDLKNLKSLVEISLSDNEIEDISPLKDLYLLESLNLSNNYIENIEAIENMESLSHLVLHGNQITDEQLYYIGENIK